MRNGRGGGVKTQGEKSLRTIRSCNLANMILHGTPKHGAPKASDSIDFPPHNWAARKQVAQHDRHEGHRKQSQTPNLRGPVQHPQQIHLRWSISWLAQVMQQWWQGRWDLQWIWP